MVMKNDNRRFASRTHGFTVVELLVVVSISAVLFTMLLPALDRAKGEAQGISCLSLHKQYAMAFIMYSVDNGDEFPMFADFYQPPTPGTSWFEITASYIGEDPNTVLKSKARLCPSGRAGVGVPYGAFRPVGPPFPTPRPNAPIVYGNHGPLLFGEVQYPSSWAMLLDTDINHHFMYTYNNWTPTVDTDADNIPDTNSALIAWIFTGAQYNGARPRVHRDSINMGMVDGHAERLAYLPFMGRVVGGQYQAHNYLRDDI